MFRILATLVTSLLVIQIGFSQVDITYEFDHEIKTEVKSYEDDKLQDSYDFDFLFPQKSNEIIGFIGNISMEGQQIESKGVINMKDRTFLALIDQAGMKMGMKMNMPEDAMDDESDNSSAATIRKTGNTKKLLGYQAEEYEIISDDSYALVWMTQEIDIPNFYEAFESMNSDKRMIDGEVPEGFMLMMTTWPEGKDSSQKFEMVVIAVNKNKKNSISSKGYMMMAMPSE